MTDRDDVTPESPEVAADGDVSSHESRHAGNYAEYEQNPRGPATIIGGSLAFLFAVIFASFIVGPAQYVMFAVMAASALVGVRGIRQLVKHRRQESESDER